ncbi:Ferritin-like [Lentzea albidocapillata subsp. violacea]|uniref:Ferritin-like n=1 Tax=Lentzea albidocapillata subsp. violacea TaxID=128104 RepID=A0A1G8Z548_9PSEU|nr:ferritin-like domain-containing protein [Lentzea albidocapillata]SDK10168.1 Ferritin-like [Lentzea albidocapillata subsp. violacea]
MSVFDLPRLHFRGTASTRLPTGPRNGLADLATNTALTADGEPFPVHRPPAEYHAHLDETGPRYDSAGRETPDGPFSAAKGRDFAGNGHFSINARVVSTELVAGRPGIEDPVVGRAVDFWGHYNEYLATTVNRARIFDVDPASDWTTTLMVGQVGFGREGRSHDVGYMATGAVKGFSPPRWHATGRGCGHWQLGRSVVHQFVVTDDDLRWLDEADVSPVARLLREAGTGGLVVQFALDGQSAPQAPDQPSQWRLHGTIAPWRPGELRTYPAGRLLVPDRGTRNRLGNLTVATSPGQVTLNMITAPVPAAAARDLELRTVRDDRLVARIPATAYTEDAAVTSGVVTVPGLLSEEDTAGDALRIVASDGVLLLREQEINLQVDDASVFVEHPRSADDAEHDVEVAVRSFVRGRPAPVRDIAVRQFANPAARPRGPVGAVVSLDTDVLETDDRGHGWFTLRGKAAGTARVLLTAVPEPAALDYDNDDKLGFWSGAGYLSVRVLPDDWHLEDVEQADYDLVYREVFAYYEHLFSFMDKEVFSLANRSRTETYAKLIWQMCDPQNKSKTYYMPPTRDLSEAKSRLLLKFLRNQQAPGHLLLPAETTVPSRNRIATRGRLVEILREAALIELAVMLQYLYAAYSVPTYGAGAEYVRLGLWTPDQLQLACGDGGETLDEGIRSMLLGIAREEMIHFLLVNNIIMALGEPFHVPRVDFGTINHALPVPLDFALERLGLGSVERFTQIEKPEHQVSDVRPRDGEPQAQRQEHGYASLSELYADIREALQQIPDLFLVDQGRGGGEHHLFLRESINHEHPDYQLEVDDLPSALYAIDVITEQGEGGVLDEDAVEDSHYTSFLLIGELLRKAPVTGPHGELWNPAYPVARNPSLNPASPAVETVTDPDARTVMQIFNESYFMALQLMAQHFGERPDASLRRSDLMNAAIDIMAGLMRPLAELLVTLPSGRRGTTAGPSFELPDVPAAISRPDVARRSIALRLDDIAAQCAKCALVPARVGELSTFWADHFRAQAGGL